MEFFSHGAGTQPAAVNAQRRCVRTNERTRRALSKTTHSRTGGCEPEGQIRGSLAKCRQPLSSPPRRPATRRHWPSRRPRPRIEDRPPSTTRTPRARLLSICSRRRARRGPRCSFSARRGPEPAGRARAHAAPLRRRRDQRRRRPGRRLRDVRVAAPRRGRDGGRARRGGAHAARRRRAGGPAQPGPGPARAGRVARRRRRGELAAASRGRCT